MKLPRLSMTTTLFVILVFAVALGVARGLLIHDRGALSVYGLGFLPMAVVLAFGLYRVARLGARSCAFTVGLIVAGLAAAGSYAAAIRLIPAFRDELEDLAQLLDDRILAVLPGGWDDSVRDLDELIVVGAILSIPPLLVAIAGGLLAHKLARGAGRPRERAPFRPRFTLGTLSVLVAVLAVDFGLIRHLVFGASFGTTCGIGFLPMINALALGLPQMLRNRKARFIFGFEVAGWSATVAYLAACVIAPEAMIGRLVAFAEVVQAALDLAFGHAHAQHFFSGSYLAGLMTEFGVVGAFFSLPPMIVALSGGAINRRFGRRSASAA